MAKESTAEKGAVKEKEENMKGKPAHGLKGEYGLDKEVPQGMKDPKSPGEEDMGGVKKSGHMGNSSMSAAVKHLNCETERHMDNQHSGKRVK